jgi:hypothetical protein
VIEAAKQDFIGFGLEVVGRRRRRRKRRKRRRKKKEISFWWFLGLYAKIIMLEWGTLT